MKSKSYMPGIALKNVNERVHICSICSTDIMMEDKNENRHKEVQRWITMFTCD